MFPTVEIIHVPPFSQWLVGHPAVTKDEKVILTKISARLSLKVNTANNQSIIIIYCKILKMCDVEEPH